MMNRRKAVITLGAARLLGFIFPSAAALAEQEAAAGGLAKELEQLGTRVYSEEGIPMFLVCENVAEKGQSGSKQHTALTKLNEVVASAFRRYASEWTRTRPNASAADVAKIVELLAHRDFAAGGREKSL